MERLVPQFGVEDFDGDGDLTVEAQEREVRRIAEDAAARAVRRRRGSKPNAAKQKAHRRAKRKATGR